MARSQTFHDTDGSTVDWDISFEGGYLSRDHVHAYFYPTANLEDERQEVAFTWVTSTRVRISPALANAGKLVLARKTPTSDSLVQFTNTADLTKENLLTVARQGVFVAAELLDVYEEPNLLGALADAKAAAAQSLVNAQAALTQAQAALGYAQTADAAQQAAETAVSTAEAAQAAAELARDEAEAAMASLSTTLSGYGKKEDANTWAQVQTFSAKPVIPAAGDTPSAPVRLDEVHGKAHMSGYDVITAAAGAAQGNAVITLPTIDNSSASNYSFTATLEVTPANATGGVYMEIVAAGIDSIVGHGLVWTNATPAQATAFNTQSSSSFTVPLVSGEAGTWAVRVRQDHIGTAVMEHKYLLSVVALSPSGKRYDLLVRYRNYSVTNFNPSAPTVYFKNVASAGSTTFKVFHSK